MFRGAEALATAIDECDVAATGDGIAHVRRLIDQLEAKAAAAAAEYSKDAGYEPDGFGSMKAFLRFRAHMTEIEARRVATRAKKLSAWPEVLDAWADGELTRSQVEVIAARVPDRHIERFADAATENVTILGPLHHSDTAAAAVRAWVEIADDAAAREAVEAGLEPGTVVPERECSASRTIDDRLELRASLDADAGARVEHALLAAGRDDIEGESRTPLERRADALVEVCRFYLAHHQAPPGAGRPDRLTIVADLPTIYRAALRGLGVRTAAQLEEFFSAHPGLGALDKGLFLDAFDGRTDTARTLDGNPITHTLLSTISDNGVLERLLTVDGRIVDHGRDVRTFTDSQRRAILARDGGCRSPGCTAGPERCDIHHIDPWESGGRTDLGNGVAKCRHDHHRHHRPGWTERLEPDGTYIVTCPNGTTRTTTPSGQATPTMVVPTSAAPAPELPFTSVAIEQLCRLPRRRAPHLDRRPPWMTIAAFLTREANRSQTPD